MSLVLVALVAAVSGCGAKAVSADEEQVRSVFEKYVRALVRPDFPEACSLMTTSQRKTWADLGRGYAAKRGKRITRHLRSLLLSGCAETHEVIYGGAGSPPAVRRRKLAGARRSVENFQIRSVRISGNTALVVSNLPMPKATLKKVNGEWRVD
jgi:hypothetical protein